MDETVGIDVTLGRGRGTVWDETIAYESIKILEKVGVRSLELNCFVNDSPVLPKLKHPNLLELISFDNFVSSRSFNSILTGVTNLHTFNITRGAIYHLNFSEINFAIPCKVLRVYAGEFYKDQDSTANNIIPINTIYLLRMYFPGLRHLIMYLYVPKKTCDAITEELVNFLYKHSESLTMVSITLLKIWRLTEDDSLPFLPPRREQQPIQDAQFKNLKTIRIYDTFLASYWMNWARRTSNLEIISLCCKIPPTEVRSIVIKNEATIKDLSIWDSEKSPLTSFYCMILQKCVKLIYLSLKFSIHLKKNKLVEARLFNGNLLPKTIVRLEISGLPVTCDDCEIFCLQFLALEELILDQNVNQLGFGVPINVAQEIIHRKQFKRFRIDAGRKEALTMLDSAYYNSNHGHISGYLQNGEYVLQVTKRPAIPLIPGSSFL